jgi:hypothetical protein
MRRISRGWIIGAVLGLVVLAVVYTGFSSVRAPAPDKESRARDAKQQAAQFIEYYHSISLTPEQEQLKNEALSTVPAPCCRDYSIATCCCPCNLAKSVWGLSHFLIAEKRYNVPQLTDAVRGWLRSTNEAGHSGDACYARRCNQPFDRDGCGGMDERHVM